LCQERPQERGQPDEGGRRQGGSGPPPDGQHRGVGDVLGGHETARADATSATVSHGCGCITLATWGANAGDPASTAAVGPSVTSSPSAMTTTRSASSVTSSKAWVAI